MKCKGIKWCLFLLIAAGIAVMVFFMQQRGDFMQQHGDQSKLRSDSESPTQIGDVIDEFNGVAVYYNGPISTTVERNTTPDGYNLGLKYQCVEFVKRYYYEALDHRMPHSWGHAKDFFDPKVEDGRINAARDLLQFHNGGMSGPAVGDLIVFGPTAGNPYGHVAIVSKVDNTSIEVVQQNMGPGGSSRDRYGLITHQGKAPKVNEERVLGWLRKAD